jgi:hypothetical protein
LRASAQGILTFTVAGLGTLLGNSVSARILDASRDPAGINWAEFWFVPALAAAVVFAVFVAFFRDDPTARPVGAPSNLVTADTVTAV